MIEKIIKYLILFLIGVLFFIVIHKVYKRCIENFNIGGPSITFPDVSNCKDDSGNNIDIDNSSIRIDRSITFTSTDLISGNYLLSAQKVFNYYEQNNPINFYYDKILRKLENGIASVGTTPIKNISFNLDSFNYMEEIFNKTLDQLDSISTTDYNFYNEDVALILNIANELPIFQVIGDNNSKYYCNKNNIKLLLRNLNITDPINLEINSNTHTFLLTLLYLNNEYFPQDIKDRINTLLTIRCLMNINTTIYPSRVIYKLLHDRYPNFDFHLNMCILNDTKIQDFLIYLNSELEKDIIDDYNEAEINADLQSIDNTHSLNFIIDELCFKEIYVNISDREGNAIREGIEIQNYFNVGGLISYPICRFYFLKEKIKTLMTTPAISGQLVLDLNSFYSTIEPNFIDFKRTFGTYIDGFKPNTILENYNNSFEYSNFYNVIFESLKFGLNTDNSSVKFSFNVHQNNYENLSYCFVEFFPQMDYFFNTILENYNSFEYSDFYNVVFESLKFGLNTDNSSVKFSFNVHQNNYEYLSYCFVEFFPQMDYFFNTSIKSLNNEGNEDVKTSCAASIPQVKTDNVTNVTNVLSYYFLLGGIDYIKYRSDIILKKRVALKSDNPDNPLDDLVGLGALQEIDALLTQLTVAGRAARTSQAALPSRPPAPTPTPLALAPAAASDVARGIMVSLSRDTDGGFSQITFRNAVKQSFAQWRTESGVDINVMLGSFDRLKTTLGIRSDNRLTSGQQLHTLQNQLTLKTRAGTLDWTNLDLSGISQEVQDVLTTPEGPIQLIINKVDAFSDTLESARYRDSSAYKLYQQEIRLDRLSQGSQELSVTAFQQIAPQVEVGTTEVSLDRIEGISLQTLSDDYNSIRDARADLIRTISSINEAIERFNARQSEQSNHIQELDDTLPQRLDGYYIDEAGNIKPSGVLGFNELMNPAADAVAIDMPQVIKSISYDYGQAPGKMAALTTASPILTGLSAISTIAVLGSHTLEYNNTLINAINTEDLFMLTVGVYLFDWQILSKVILRTTASMARGPGGFFRARLERDAGDILSLGWVKHTQTEIASEYFKNSIQQLMIHVQEEYNAVNPTVVDPTNLQIKSFLLEGTLYGGSRGMTAINTGGFLDQSVINFFNDGTIDGQYDTWQQGILFRYLSTVTKTKLGDNDILSRRLYSISLRLLNFKKSPDRFDKMTFLRDLWGDITTGDTYLIGQQLRNLREHMPSRGDAWSYIGKLGLDIGSRNPYTRASLSTKLEYFRDQGLFQHYIGDVQETLQGQEQAHVTRNTRIIATLLNFNYNPNIVDLSQGIGSIILIGWACKGLFNSFVSSGPEPEPVGPEPEPVGPEPEPVGPEPEPVSCENTCFYNIETCGTDKCYNTIVESIVGNTEFIDKNTGMKIYGIYDKRDVIIVAGGRVDAPGTPATSLTECCNINKAINPISRECKWKIGPDVIKCGCDYYSDTSEDSTVNTATQFSGALDNVTKIDSDGTETNLFTNLLANLKLYNDYIYEKYKDSSNITCTDDSNSNKDTCRITSTNLNRIDPKLHCQWNGTRL